jgi:hypothetical protein
LNSGSVAFPDGCLQQLLEPFGLHLMQAGHFFEEVPAVKMTWENPNQLAICLESELIQTESRVSMDRHFKLDGDLAHNVTVGTRAIRMKTLESSRPEFEHRICVKNRNACK